MNYTMSESVSIADQGYLDIETYLLSQPNTRSVIDVQDHELFRKLDIDLIQVRDCGGVYTIELKVDRHHLSGNYFFETVSNTTKGTDGCFLYTQCDFLFYYFITIKELHIFKMETIREWFLLHKDEFKQRTTSTKVGEDSYETLGRLVPKDVVWECVPVKIINLDT